MSASYVSTEGISFSAIAGSFFFFIARVILSFQVVVVISSFVDVLVLIRVLFFRGFSLLSRCFGFD